MPITFNEDGWDQMLKGVVAEHLEPRATAVSDACNEALDAEDGQGYYISTEGSKPLRKHDYRATVIAVTNEAKHDNMVNNTLVNNFHRAEGSP